MVDVDVYKDDAAAGQSTHRHLLEFNNLTKQVGKGREILSGVSGRAGSKDVLAILGPSGAGKTTLLRMLSLESRSGIPSGDIMLDGVPLTKNIFQRHCYVVKQQDTHWDHLTVRESLYYAAELYAITSPSSEVDNLLSKLGLTSASSTRCIRLSGGQRRRLSLAFALLKKPAVLFLDECTSGLDSAASYTIIDEIRRLAESENLIVVCTIHQPSTRVFHCFRQVMILSQGRQAFLGPIGDLVEYFDSVGFPLPPETNPAEYVLDLVNSDFGGAEQVKELLDHWEHHGLRSKKGEAELAATTMVNGWIETPPAHNSLTREMWILLRRHALLTIRDPVLYLGRCIFFLLSNILFAAVYLHVRDFEQSQAINLIWVNIFFVAVPANMGAVAVYSLGYEFKSILAETQNGVLHPVSYLWAKSGMVVLVMFGFGLSALGIPGYLILDFPPESFGLVLVLWSTCIYSFECLAEALAIWIDNHLLGMLIYMLWYFCSFLFAGFFVPQEDLYWPFKLFHYIVPFTYCWRGISYVTFTHSTWKSCVSDSSFQVCTNSTQGSDVLDVISNSFTLVSSKDTVKTDILAMLAIALSFKLFVVLGVLYKAEAQFSKIQASANEIDPLVKERKTSIGSPSTVAYGGSPADSSCEDEVSV